MATANALEHPQADPLDVETPEGYESINGVLVEFGGIPSQTLIATDFTFRFRGASPTASWGGSDSWPPE